MEHRPERRAHVLLKTVPPARGCRRAGCACGSVSAEARRLTPLHTNATATLIVMTVKEHEAVAAELDRAERRLRDAEKDLAAVREHVLRIGVDDAAGGTVAELAARLGVDADGLRAFVRTLRELVGDRPLSVGAARRAALLIAAEELWEGQLGPLLSSAQVRELLGGVSRQRVDELLRARRLIGLSDASGRRRFPAFQFGDGRPLVSLVEAFWTLAASAESEWTAAGWCTAPNDELEASSPVAWAAHGRDSERLALVAARDAERLAR